MDEGLDDDGRPRPADDADVLRRASDGLPVLNIVGDVPRLLVSAVDTATHSRARTAPDGTGTGATAVVDDVTTRVRERAAGGREMIDALQRHLLPADLPVLPGVRIAASYLPAESVTAAGGDWFDALALPGGRVGLVVGDVAGHGPSAAAAMGQLRTLLHEYLITGSSPRDAVRAVDAAAERVAGARAATICLVALDPVTGEFEYCTAGHPPPLRVSPKGRTRYLDHTGAGPLGVGTPFTDEMFRTAHLTTGALLLLYTDGIVERPGTDLAHSAVELARVVADAATDRSPGGAAMAAVDRVCGRAVRSLTRDTGHSDDIVLLGAQLTEPPPPLVMTVPADTTFLRDVRRRLDAWLTTLDITRRDADALRHAVIELATNAMNHAFIDSAGPHTFLLTAALTEAGEVHLEVADQGAWREPQRSADRGLGLQLTAALVDVVQVDHDEHGTTSRVRHRLSRPPWLLDAADSGDGAATAKSRDPLRVVDDPAAGRPCVRMSGSLDAGSVEAFDRAARSVGVTGTRPLTVDLTEVTHLGSAGVAALHRLAGLHRGNGSDLRLVAPAGSPAGMIMSLVRLHYRTPDPDQP